MFWHFFHQIHFFSVFFRRVLIFPYCIYIVVLLSEAYLEHYLETYFNLHMIYMAVFDWITLVRLKEILTLNSVEVSSNPNSTPLFVIVFWGETNRSSLSQMFFKIGVLKNFANFIGKHQCWSIFLIKLQVWTLLKRDFRQLFSCEISDIFKNTFFYRTPPVAASEQTQEIYVVYCVHCVEKWCSGHLAQVYHSCPISC